MKKLVETLKNLLKEVPEDESHEEEFSMLDSILGFITIASMMLLLFVVVPLLFG